MTRENFPRHGSRVQRAHGVDAPVEGFVSNALLLVPLADGKAFDEFRANVSDVSCLKYVSLYETGK